MSYNIKYRPDSLELVKGNADIIITLEKLLSKGKDCPHAFLLHGQTGTGKTTIARIIAKKLQCKGNDFIEVNTADFRGIDTVRDMISKANYKPMQGSCRIWLFDEIHKMTGDAQNALLKILEDPPDHVYFILCTTDPQRILSTIKRRCQQFQTKPLRNSHMFSLLKSIVESEEETLEKEVYDQIIISSQGLPGNAVQILEQVLCMPKDRRVEYAKQKVKEEAQTIDLCRALLNGDSWKKVAGILNGLKDQDPETIRRSVLGYCQTILLDGTDDKFCGLIMEEFINPFYDSGFPQLTFACYMIAKK